MLCEIRTKMKNKELEISSCLKVESESSEEVAEVGGTYSGDRSENLRRRRLANLSLSENVEIF